MESRHNFHDLPQNGDDLRNQWQSIYARYRSVRRRTLPSRKDQATRKKTSESGPGPDSELKCIPNECPPHRRPVPVPRRNIVDRGKS